MSSVGHWRVERDGFKPRGNRWEPFAAGSTNRLWRTSGPSGDWLLKWYKYPQCGIHPEPEVARFLQSQGLTCVPEFGARLDRQQPDGFATIAYIQRWIPGLSAWDLTLEALRQGTCLRNWAKTLGRLIGALHAALAGGHPTTSPAFCTLAYSTHHHERWIRRLKSVAERLQTALQNPPPLGMPYAAWEKACALWLEGEAHWRERVRLLESVRAIGSCSRIHGDLHLGQILESQHHNSPSRWWVVDFEGEPLRPLEERRVPDLPLRDVAGMWRSFAYAAAVAKVPADAAVPLQESFLEGWKEQMPALEGDWNALLQGLVWEKSIYEALYEISHRPSWFWVPLCSLA